MLERNAGCRVRAVVGMRVQDLDLDRRMAYLREKGDKRHFGFFTERTRCALYAWLGVRPDDRGHRLFLSLGSNGNGALSAQGIRQVLRRLKRKAGVKGPVNPHSFRHASSREYLKNGSDLASLADLLSHSDVRVTWQAYAVFTFDELKAAHERFSTVIQLARDYVS